jgi:hypothetical protein
LLPSRARLAAGALLLAGSSLLAPAAPAFADHQCSGVPSCVTVSSGEITLSRLGSTSRVMTCPDNATWIWGEAWDKSSRSVTVSSIGTAMFHSARFTATN